jgi:hypothetical protein
LHAAISMIEVGLRGVKETAAQVLD